MFQSVNTTVTCVHVFTS